MTTTTTTNTSAPWPAVQPYLKDIAGSVMDVGQNRFMPAPGSDQAVPFSNNTNAALTSAWYMAMQGNPQATTAYNQLGGMLGTNGVQSWLNPTISNQLNISTGGSGINTGGDYASLYGLAGQGGPLQGLLGNYANGSSLGANTTNAYNNLYGQAGQSSPLSSWLTGIANGSQTAVNTGNAYNNLYGQFAGSGPGPVAQMVAGFGNGSEGLGMEGGYRGLYGSNPNALQQYAGGIASGANGINTEGAYRNLGANGSPNTESDYRNLLANSGNDAWAHAVDTQSGKIADEVQQRIGMQGRTGSTYNVDDLTGAIGDFRERALSDHWDQNIAAQRGLLGDITGLQQQGFGNQANILNSISGLQGQNINNRLGAAGALSGEQQQGFGNNLGILNNITGMRQSDISNRMNAAGMVGNEYNQNIANQFNALGNLSNVSNQNYQNQLATAGMLGNQYQQQFGNQLSALGGLTNTSFGNTDRLFSAANSLGNEYQQGFGNQLSALGGLTGVQGQNLSNQMQASMNQLGISNSSYQNQLAAMGMMPSMYDQQYAGTDREMQMGSMYDDLATRQQQAQQDYWTQQQQAPLNQLAWQSGLINGTGGMGGTQQQQVTAPTNYFGNLLGGGAAIASLLGSLFG